MSKVRLIHAVLLSCAVASAASMAFAAQQGEIAVAQTVPNMRVFCEHRIAAIFPGEPKIEDIMYKNGDMTVPARVFYVEEGMHRYSVTVADFTKGGPAIDDTIVENAAVALRQTGEVRFQFPEDYTPGIPGRQLNIFAPDGRQHRASVYMVDHRLVITETLAEPSDFAAIQFEQSVLMLDGTGRDLNNVANRTRYACGR
jgi:hypothetical protein